MEFNRRWGIAKQVKSTGWPQTHPNDFVYCTSMCGYELARVKVAPYVERPLAYSPEPPCGCASIFYEPVLVQHIESLPSVSTKLRHSLDAFTQDADGVSATVTNHVTGENEVIRCQYLVGCDGASSSVAKGLGVTYEGVGTLTKSVNVFFRSPDLHRIHDKGWARFYRFTDGNGSWGELIPLDGKELFRLSTFEADAAFDADAAIRRLVGKDVGYEVRSVLRWDRQERVVDRYNDGRVFLAGDSAHANSPTGGLGLHTGLADAVDLGWKLYAVLQGWGGDALLSSYALERRPVAVNNVRACTNEYSFLSGLMGGPEIDQDSETGAALRKQWSEGFHEIHQWGGYQFNDNLRMGYCYEESPLIVPDGTTAPPLDSPEFVPVARPGTRAPHAWITPDRSTLDLFGQGFVLLRLGPDAPSGEGIARAAATRGVPLAVVDVPDPEIAALYDRALVLVRPDGHVAWRSDEAPADPASLIDRVRGTRAVAVVSDEGTMTRRFRIEDIDSIFERPRRGE